MTDFVTKSKVILSFFTESNLENHCRHHIMQNCRTATRIKQTTRAAPLSPHLRTRWEIAHKCEMFALHSYLLTVGTTCVHITRQEESTAHAKTHFLTDRSKLLVIARSYEKQHAVGLPHPCPGADYAPTLSLFSKSSCPQ